MLLAGLGEEGHAKTARDEAEFGSSGALEGIYAGRACGYLQGDFESERFELGDEAARPPLGVLAAGEVVVAEILEQLAGAQQMPDELDQGMGDGDGGLVGACGVR
jgi:hypothetical protein